MIMNRRKDQGVFPLHTWPLETISSRSWIDEDAPQLPWRAERRSSVLPVMAQAKSEAKPLGDLAKNDRGDGH